MAFEQGLDGLWTPRADANRAGCEPSCNACGQVCPTGAIRALTLDEKKATRMGLAVVNEKTCLPHAGRGECSLCVDACRYAGYDAILVSRKPFGEVEMDEFGFPVGEVNFLDAPMVVAEKCVGCGLCQSRCHSINVAEKGTLAESAIAVRARPRGERPATEDTESTESTENGGRIG
jgi:ferredoxin